MNAKSNLVGICLITCFVIALNACGAEKPSAEKKPSTSRATKTTKSQTPPKEYDPVALRQGAALYKKSGCLVCHKTDGFSSGLGANLAGIMSRMKRDEVEAWIRDPQSKKRGTAMPAFAGSNEELEKLLNYLEMLN